MCIFFDCFFFRNVDGHLGFLAAILALAPFWKLIFFFECSVVIALIYVFEMLTKRKYQFFSGSLKYLRKLLIIKYSLR